MAVAWAALAAAQTPAPAAVLEIRLVADGGASTTEDAKPELDQERQRLVAWLDQGDNRARLMQQPQHLERFHALPKDQGGRLSGDVRWYPRLLRDDPAATGRFEATEALTDGTPVVALFSPAEYAAGPTTERETLVELWPLDMKAMAFGNADLERVSAYLDTESGRHALRYAIAPARAEHYRAWTAAHVGRRCAVVVNGQARSVARLDGTSSTEGIVSSGFTFGEAVDLGRAFAAALTPPAGATDVRGAEAGPVPSGADPADLRAIQGAQAMLAAEKRLRELIKSGQLTGIDKILTFEEISSWPYEDGLQGCPSHVLKLDNQSVLMTGFMLPIDEVENIKEFLLVQSLWSCCYGSPPDINGIVRVVMRGDSRLDYQFEPIKVTGTFTVKATHEEGYCVDIYQLSADAVEVLR